MPHTRVAFAAAACIALGAVPEPTARQDRATVFRSRTEIVSVPVVVLSGRRHVTGLTAGDFELKDNGILQRLDSVEPIAEAMPIDVSLVVDVSGSTAASLRRYQSDVLQMSAMLRPEDRVRLVAFGTRVTEVFSLQPPHSDLPVHKLETMGLTALYDALVSVLIRPVPYERAHLIVVFTDGNDNMSVTTGDVVRDVAARSDAVLHVVLTDGVGRSLATMGLQPLIGRLDPDGEQALIKIAESTGGRRGWPGVFSNSAVGAFREALADFRASYVLRYRPQVLPADQHVITVDVTRKGTFTVRARRGYSSR
jgi:VWFA-related protein